MVEINWLNAAPQTFLAFGMGCVMTYAFMNKTLIADAKRAAEQEKELMRQNHQNETNLLREKFQLAMIKEEEQKDLLQNQVIELKKRVEKLESIVLRDNELKTNKIAC